MRSPRQTKRQSKKFLVRIGRGRRITIPKEIMEALHLKVGDFLKATLDRKKQYLILRPIREISLGVIKDKNIMRGHRLRIGGGPSQLKDVYRAGLPYVIL